MKPNPILHSRHVLATGLLASLLSTGLAGAATTLIDPTTNNGSFEYVNGVNNPAFTAKITHWDTHSEGDVDNWTLWAGVATSSDDSGIQHSTSTTDGVRFAFLQPGNAVYNLTSYFAAAGDSFTFSWDHIGGNYAHTVSLVYFNGTDVISIAASGVDSGTAPGNGKGGTYVIPDDSPAIGYQIGLGVVNNSVDWPNIDNFVLSVESVPEPSTALLGGLGLLALFQRRKTR